MKRLIILMPVIGLMMFTSCATLLTGTQDKIIINSTPPRADVYVDGEKKGITGEDIYLKRKYINYRNVELRKEGYENEFFKIPQKIVGAYFLGFLGAGIPMIIDIGTGAALKPKECEYNRVLTPIKPKDE